MQRYNGVPKQSNPEAWGQLRGASSLLRWLFFVAAIALILTNLACAFMGTGSRSIADMAITRLPTLTRTPLPTLTPTAIGTAQAAAMLAEPVAAAPAAADSVVSPNSVTVNPPDVSVATLASPASATVNLPDISAAPLTLAPANISEAVNSPNPSSSLAAVPLDETANPANAGINSASTPAAPSTVTSPLPIDTPPATLLPPATDTPAPTPTATPGTTGWSFANVRLSNDQDEGHLLLFGDMVNDTGASQLIGFLTGTFYDGQGQVIASEDNTFDYWPIELVPPDGRIPFELAVGGIQGAANFDLRVQSETSNQVPRQDFNFAEVNQWQDGDSYCLEGALQNPGGELQQYIAVVAILYDSQNNVINFSDTFESDPQGISGDQTLGFEVCVEPPNQNVARYELRAWGE
jgi:hypothetical protein